MPTSRAFEGERRHARTPRREFFAMTAARDYVLGLGSNLGSRVALLQAAIALLRTWAACEVTALSSVLQTAPIGPPQPHYLNQALRVRTPHQPEALWAQLAAIEDALGRTRTVRWGPRTIDVDVLWAPEPIRTASLQVPHRELERRWFALAGLLEVAPELTQRYAPVLAQLDVPPPSPFSGVAQLRQRREGDSLRVSVQAPDVADALALAAQALATQDAAPTQVRTARVQCGAGEQVRAVVEEVRARTAAGFAVAAAPIVSLEPGHVELRLLGSPASPRRPPELVEARQRSTGSDCALELVFSEAASAV
jgi:2-amino-4-hydroxy-6-hydroxymethyldihydropteridine diphosphokinase